MVVLMSSSPICYEEMKESEDIIWCKSSCGNNMHKKCFEMWKTSKKGGPVTCVYCRAEWDEENTKSVGHKESYVNLAKLQVRFSRQVVE